MTASSQPDYFAVFGLPRKLNIDLAALEREFYRLSRKVHPDVYATRSVEEQQWSLDQTSLLNDAYRTLRNPITRTEHLLALEGTVLEAGKSEDGGPKDSRVPPDLLEEVFELNMQLEEARANSKTGKYDYGLLADLEETLGKFEWQLADLDSNLQQQWANWDSALAAGSADDKAKIVNGLVTLLDRRRYIRNLVRDMNDALDA